MDVSRHFPAEVLTRTARFGRERRAVLLVTLATAWVSWLAFGVLGCTAALRDAAARAVPSGGAPAAGAAAVAYFLTAAGVLGPLGYLRARALPAAWGLPVPAFGAWLARAALGLVAALGAAFLLGAAFHLLAVRHPERLGLWIALPFWGFGAWASRGRPGAVGMAVRLAAVSLLLGGVGQALVGRAAALGLWGVTGAEDPAAWPLLAVVLSVVVLPLVPWVLGAGRRAALRADAARLAADGEEPFVRRVVDETLGRMEEVDPPSWSLRLMSARPSAAERLALLSLSPMKEGSS